jgi:carbonic anhydrase
MNRRNALWALAGTLICPLCRTNAFAAEDAHWSYEGRNGPAKWAELDASNKACSIGSQQSPIDINATVSAQLAPLKIEWADAADTIGNNGHTIQLNVANGGTLTLDDRKYKLVQFHFHRPSEHTIGGKRFPMEAHFVHPEDSGALAVIGVLMIAGSPNVAFNRIVATMPAHEAPPVKADGRINPNSLLPASRSYYRYSGSLTTPPCAENVEWLLLGTPLQVSEADIATFATLYPGNARPAQHTNRRYVLKSM